MKLAIVEDNPHITKDIKFLLEKECQDIGIEILGAFQHPNNLMDFLLRAETGAIPDLIISDADFGMGKLEVEYAASLSAIRNIKSDEKLKSCKIIVVTRHSSSESLFFDMYPHIDGFVDKDELSSELVRAVKAFHFGDDTTTYFNKFRPWATEAQNKAQNPWDGLSDRQVEILDYLLRGVPRTTWTVDADAPTITREIERIFKQLCTVSKLGEDYTREARRGKLDLKVAILKMCIELDHPQMKKKN